MTTPDLTEDEFLDEVDTLVKQHIRNRADTRGREAIIDGYMYIHASDYSEFVANHGAEVEAYSPEVDIGMSEYESLERHVSGGPVRELLEKARELLFTELLRQRAEALVEGGEWDAVAEKEETVTETVTVGDEEKTVEGTETYYVLEE